MARYESPSRQDRPARAAALPYAPSPLMPSPLTTAAPALSMGDLVGILRAALLALLLVCWVTGAYAGIVFWSLQGSLLGVIASAVVPGLAATSTWWAFKALDRTPNRNR
jgi:hypothetical protein